MTESNPAVTLDTLHGDLTAMHGDLKTTLVAGSEAQRLLIDSHRSLSIDIKALVARLDALIRGRGNGEPTA